MKKLWIFFTIILLVMSLIGCSNSSDFDYYEVLPLNFLDGTWEGPFPGEMYIFAANTLTNDGSFVATIHEIGSWSSDNTSGIVIIEYTDKNPGGYWEWATDPSDLNFTAFYFTNKTASTVEFASAVYGGVTPTKASVAEVKSHFTVHNVTTYFAMTSACVKQ